MNESQVFADALKLATPAERAAYLDRACVGDAQLRAGVEALLRAHESDPGFLEPPAAVPGETMDAVPATGSLAGAEQSGLVLAGRDKLLEPVGEGGMGTVWMAEQTEPVRRLVAVKLIKAGMDSRAVLARFEAERQALALMDHPNIAKVLDAGAAPDGRPFFVMELVRGVPITKYCDDHKLTPRQRLELFVPVCQAIQHAHQKGVIHRDIKPNNVLVALYDDRPVPKVIDFGVAKATGQPLTEKTLHTGFGAVVGTPEYMSPEQASFNQLDVDTRSDVYSLGVLLYELLAGSPPFPRTDLARAGLLEMLRVVREQEPQKPSTRLSTADGLPGLAASRGTEPRRLCGLVRGELDWIVLKALEKDRGRRYETANGFAADVQRYLADETVQACPPSSGYRLRKFFRRNRRILGTAAALALVLVLAGAAATALVWREAQRTRAANERLQGNLRLAMKALDEIYLGVSGDRLMRDPGRQKEDDELLRNALRFYEEFAEQNGTDPGVRREVGRAYSRVGGIRRALGQHAAAKEAYHRSIAVLEQLVAEVPGDPDYRVDLAYSHNHLANTLLDEGDPGAERHFGRALELLTRVAAEHPGEPRYLYQLGGLHNDLGFRSRGAGKLAVSERHARQSVELLARAVAISPDPRCRKALVLAYNNFGSTLQEKGDAAAADQYRAAVTAGTGLADEHPTPEHRFHLAVSHICLSGALPTDPAKAADHARRGIDLVERVVKDAPTVPNYRFYQMFGHKRLADILADRGDHAPSAESYLRAIEVGTRLAQDYPQTAKYQLVLANLHFDLGAEYTDRGDGARAADQYRQALAVFEKRAARFPTLQHDPLAWFLATCPDPRFRDPPRAVRLAERDVARTPESAAYRNTLGIACYRAGDWIAAAAALRESIRLGGGDSSDWLFLAMAQWRLGERDEARESYARALRHGPEQYPRRAEEYRRFRAEAAQLLGIKVDKSK